MMTAEKFKEHFNIWSNLFIAGLDTLSQEDSLELVHVQDAFERVLLSKRAADAGPRRSPSEADDTASRMRAELDQTPGDNFRGQPVCLFSGRGTTSPRQPSASVLGAPVPDACRLLQRLRTGEGELRQELHRARVNFEEALRGVEVSTFLILEESGAAISQLQGALERKSDDAEELQKCLAGANEEVALIELRCAEHEAKFKAQEAKDLSLSITLEAKERELQSLQALVEGGAVELLDTKAALEETNRELEAGASRLRAEREAAASRLGEAARESARGAEEAQMLLAEAREETGRKEALLSEAEVKLEDQAARVRNLTAALEERDQELQKRHGAQRSREAELRDVRVALERALLELESHSSAVLRENELMRSQLRGTLAGTLSGKPEDPELFRFPLGDVGASPREDRRDLPAEAARKELMPQQHEIKMEDHRSEGPNITTTLEGKGPGLQHKVELEGRRRHEEEMLQAWDLPCKEASESRTCTATDAEKEESRREQPSGESGGPESLGEAAEAAPMKTPAALLHSVPQTQDQDWDYWATLWNILEGKETAKEGRRQKEEQAKILRANIHLRVKNGPCQIQLL